MAKKVPKKPGACIKVKVNGRGHRWMCRQADGKVQFAPASAGKKKSKGKSKR